MRICLLFFTLLFTTLTLLGQVPEFKLNRTFGTPVNVPYDITLDRANFMYVLEGMSINKLDPDGTLVKTFHLYPDFRTGTGCALEVDKNGNLYVINASKAAVEKYTPQGELVLKFSAIVSLKGKYQSSDGLTLDEAGNIYVTDKLNDRIVKFSPNGEILFEYIVSDDALKQDDNPNDIAVGKSGTIYFLTDDYRVFKISDKGQLIDSFRVSNPNINTSVGPGNTLALDESENIYVSNIIDKRIFTLTSSGQYLQSFGKENPNAGGFTGYKIGIAISQNGDVYATDRTDGWSSTIQIFSPTGELKKRMGNLENYRAITQDNQGNYYLLSESSIKKFNSYGKLIIQFGSIGREAGKLWAPVALAVDALGNIYCLESENGVIDWARIQKFNKEGKYLGKFEDFGNDASHKIFSDLALDIQGNIYLTDYIGGCVRKLSSTGKFLRKYASRGTGQGQVYCPKALTLDVRGNLYVADYNGDRIQKFSPDGQFLTEMNSAITPGENVNTQPASVAVDLAGNVYAWNGFSGFIRRYHASGEEAEKMVETFGMVSINRNGTKLLQTRRSLVWEFILGDAPKQSLISGNVYQDINFNCQVDANDKPLPGIVVTAEPGPFYGISDELGNYSIPVDTGNYTVKTILPQEVGRTIMPTCPATISQSVTINNFEREVTGPNFGHQVTTAPVLNVEVVSNRRRRCFRNVTTVSYANTGFATAGNAKVTVQLPEFVSFISADKLHSKDPKGNYIFTIGDLQPNQRGTITIIDSVSCADPSIRGLTVCTKAWITPINNYNVPPTWNRAEINVSGKITADGQARFVIRNIGQGDMTDSLFFRVYQDADLILMKSYKLAVQDSLVLRFAPQGRVIRVEVDQPEGHPLKATAGTNLENRKSNAAGIPAILMMAAPPDEPEPEIGGDCQPIIDSFDPNDKQVIPVGFTSENYTPTNTPLHYTIRFQNTGTDVAYRVVVVDTLSADLDLSTLQVNVASHAYQLTITGKQQPVLTFTFNNIMLPDSSKDQTGSNGLIQFSIKPKGNLQEKTKIQNFADIFFDYNEPVRTNTTVNRIFDMPQVINTAKQLSAQEVIISPTIYSFSPDQSRPGKIVTVTGSHFAANASENKVTFNGIAATVLNATSVAITVVVPANAFSGKIKVVTADGAAQSREDYIIFQPPTLTAVSPIEAIPGTIITLTGNYFSSNASLDTVTFNGLPAKVLKASETRLQVEVPAGASTGKIIIKTLGGQVESASPFAVWYPPVISDFNPGKAKAGTRLTLNGHNFAEAANRNVVQFGSTPAEVLEASATHLLVKVPATAPTGKIWVQTPGGRTSTPTEFTFIPVPEISGFTPTQGSAGTTVTITGRHFNADGQTDTVFFNNKPAKVLKATEISLEVVAPRGITSGTILVAGAGGRAVASRFVVLDLKPQDAISVYPNPTKADITINWFKANFEVESLHIFNSIGKLVMQNDLLKIPNGELQLTLSSLTPGIYTIRLQTSEETIIKRLVIL